MFGSICQRNLNKNTTVITISAPHLVCPLAPLPPWEFGSLGIWELGSLGAWEEARLTERIARNCHQPDGN